MDMPDDIEIVDDIEEGAAADPAKAVARLKDKLKRCEADKKEYLDGWQRAKADLVNSRRDEERRLRDWRDRLENEIILEFISAIDSFDVALGARNRGHLSSETEKGFHLIRSQFGDVLRRLGVDEVPTKEIQFNPAVHEAIEEIESDAPEGQIVEELQKGYTRHGTILRPARVKVSKGKDSVERKADSGA